MWERARESACCQVFCTAWAVRTEAEMDIAGASVMMSMASAKMDAGYAIAGKAMDTAEVQATALLDMMEQSVPSFGHQLDIRV